MSNNKALIGVGVAVSGLGAWAFSKFNKNGDKAQVTNNSSIKTKEGKKLPTKVYDLNKQPQQLNAELARGGEGAVFPLNGRPEVLVKIYHPEKIHKDGEYLKKKIEAMTSLRNNFEHTPLCWPRISVYGENGDWVGYAMKRGKGVSMNKLAHAVLYKKHFPHLNRNHIVQYLLNFIEAIALLHKSNVYVGDFNLNNVLCDPQSNAVTLIDCDSYQLSVNGRFFPCLVGSPDLTPIEHHGCDFRQVVRTAESDAFSLAIILFKCLMLGRHPYDVIGGEDPVSNMKNGYFPYGTGTKGLPPGHWYNIWSHMPYRLKSLFIKNFTDGAKSFSERPTLAEWKEALKIYQREIKKGFHEEVIIPSKPKKSEPR